MEAPDSRLEDAARAEGFARIAGVDEAGCGPLAGPVTAAAVVLNRDDIPAGLNDSKKLTRARREALFAALLARADVAIAHASVAEIDRLNILKAAHLAMRRALAMLAPSPVLALVDGNRLPDALSCPARAVVRGDARVLSIAAASILAKVARDRLMADLARAYPAYGWDRNAGYPSQAHKQAMLEFGLTPHHRRSFRPVHNILYQDDA